MKKNFFKCNLFAIFFHRVDTIFSNWLLMYLSTEEVGALFTRMLGWLKDDGILFFRESCFQQSGNQSLNIVFNLARRKLVYNLSLYFDG